MKTISSTWCGGRLLYGGTVLRGGNRAKRHRAERVVAAKMRDRRNPRAQTEVCAAGGTVSRASYHGLALPDSEEPKRWFPFSLGTSERTALRGGIRTGVRRRGLVGRTIFGGRCRRCCHRSGWARRRFRPGRRRRRRLKVWGRGRGR